MTKYNSLIAKTLKITPQRASLVEGYLRLKHGGTLDSISAAAIRRAYQGRKGIGAQIDADWQAAVKLADSYGVLVALPPASDVQEEVHVTEAPSVEKNEADAKKDLQSATADGRLETSETNQPVTPATQEKKTMEPVAKTMTFTKLSKSGAYAIYSGLRAKIRIAATNFPDPKNPPATWQAIGEFAGPREKKAPMTAEERKAARAAAPKLGLAEKAAKAKARWEKLQAQAAAEGVTLPEATPEAQQAVGSF